MVLTFPILTRILEVCSDTPEQRFVVKDRSEMLTTYEHDFGLGCPGLVKGRDENRALNFLKDSTLSYSDVQHE